MQQTTHPLIERALANEGVFNLALRGADDNRAITEQVEAVTTNALSAVHEVVKTAEQLENLIVDRKSVV